MRALSRLLQDRTFLKGLLALALCYALMVQSAGGHHDRFFTDAAGLHALCLNDNNSSSGDPAPDPSQNRNVPCCLIFGIGDLPRISPIITAIRFAILLADQPPQEFLHPYKTLAALGPAQPRAPPRMG